MNTIVNTFPTFEWVGSDYFYITNPGWVKGQPFFSGSGRDPWTTATVHAWLYFPAFSGEVGPCMHGFIFQPSPVRLDSRLLEEAMPTLPTTDTSCRTE